MLYRDPLPEDCPPPEAAEINRPSVFFRMVHNDPPTEADFLSLRQLNPERPYPGAPECWVRGVSLFARRNDLLKRFPRRDPAKVMVARVVLDAGMGSLLKTGSRSHFTWWPTDGIDYGERCSVERP